jgi:hypothetical protein
VNNSFKIEIVDARTFKHMATIVDTTATQNTSYVRYALGIDDNKAYVTNGNYAGEVEVIDLYQYNYQKYQCRQRTRTISNGWQQCLCV